MHVADEMFLGGIVLMVAFCLLSLALCGKRKSDTKDENKKVAITKRNVWIKSSIIFSALYYWTVLSSIMTTLIVLYISCYENMDDAGMRERVFLYSAISLMLSIIPYVVNLLGLSKAYRKAFLIMEKAITSNEKIEEAIKNGEEIIDDSF